jgi:hypothetical protein
MLSDRDCQLLTAYVDGELSTRQRKAALRLLQRSSEARTYLRQLQANADAIRRLPRPKLDADFPLRVLRTITERGLRPGREPVPARRGTPAWVGWAAAAAVLVSVSALSYFTFPLFQKGNRHETRVVGGPGSADQPQPQDNPKDAPRRVRDRKDKGAVAKRPQPPAPFNPMLFLNDWKPEDRQPPADRQPAPKKRPPRRDRRDVLTAIRGPDLPPVAAPNLSVMLPLQDLARAEDQARLLTKLRQDNAYHVQLLCRHPATALAELRQALAARGIRLLIDRAALARLKNRRLRTNFVLYTENHKPEELLAILQHLGRLDRTPPGKAPGPHQFSYLVVNAMTRSLRQQVVRFVGKDPVGKVSLRQALVLAYNADNSPVRPRPGLSREVKQFRKLRGERLPNTLQVILVLRRE